MMRRTVQTVGGVVSSHDADDARDDDMLRSQSEALDLANKDKYHRKLQQASKLNKMQRLHRLRSDNDNIFRTSESSVYNKKAVDL